AGDRASRPGSTTAPRAGGHGTRPPKTTTRPPCGGRVGGIDGAGAAPALGSATHRNGGRRRRGGGAGGGGRRGRRAGRAELLELRRVALRATGELVVDRQVRGVGAAQDARGDRDDQVLADLRARLALEQRAEDR